MNQPEPPISASPRFRRAWNEQDRYGWVLFLLALDIAALLVLPPKNWTHLVQILLISITLLLALRTSGAAGRVMRFAWIACGVAVVSAVAIVAFGTTRTSGGTYFLVAALLFVTPFPILRRVLGHEEVSAQTLAGALSVYLVIGLFFAFLFLGMGSVDSTPFFVQTSTPTPPDYVYFSYVTELTIGYGDFTPAGDIGRFLSIMDGMLGQIFLVTTVARLVSMFGKPPVRPSSGPTEAS
jgi:hypothetical protein